MTEKLSEQVSYADNVGTEPLGAYEAVREVEGHHETRDETDGRSDTGLIVDSVQPDSYPSRSLPGGRALVQWCPAKPLVANKVGSRKIL